MLVSPLLYNTFVLSGVVKCQFLFRDVDHLEVMLTVEMSIFVHHGCVNSRVTQSVMVCSGMSWLMALIICLFTLCC